jgi:hypothetical protein
LPRAVKVSVVLKATRVSEDEAHDFALLQLELQAMTTNRDDWRRTAEMCAEECSEAWQAVKMPARG